MTKKPKIEKDRPKLRGGDVRYSNEDRSKSREETKKQPKPRTNP